MKNANNTIGYRMSSIASNTKTSRVERNVPTVAHAPGVTRMLSTATSDDQEKPLIALIKICRVKRKNDSDLHFTYSLKASVTFKRVVLHICFTKCFCPAVRNTIVYFFSPDKKIQCFK